MSINDDALAAVRRRPAYRVGLWLGRMAVIPGLMPFFVAVLDDGVDLADAVFVWFWPYAGMLAGAAALIWRSRTTAGKNGGSVIASADVRLNRAIVSDLFFRKN